MSTREVFLDTAALVALTLQRDSFHAAATRIEIDLANEGVSFVTSDWVLAEFLNFGSRSEARDAASRVIQRLQKSRRTTIVAATREGWKEAFDLYRSRSDKEWSFVDCASIVLCKARGISRVFTNDHHFTQAGFEVLLY